MSSHDSETPKGSPVELKRGRTEQDLREQQQLLDTLLTNLPGLVYRCRNDPQWTILFMSAGCLELTGYQPDDFINNRKLDYASLIHPDDREYVWNGVQAAVAVRQPFELQYRIRTIDGKEKYVWERGRGIFSDAGELLALEGYVTDVTEHKQIELTLRENEERFRGLTELSSDWYWEQDASFRFTLVTLSIGAKGRFPTGETLGKTRWELPYLDVPPAVWAEHKRQLAAHEPFHDLVLKRRNAEGNIRYSSLSGVPILDTQGVFKGYRGTGRDVTEHVRAESERQRLTSAIEQTADLVIITDPDGVIQYVNPAYEATTGYRREEALGKKPSILKSGTHNVAFYERLWSTIRRGAVFRGRLVNRRKDGSLYHEEKTITPIKNERGEITHFVSTGKDITERKHAEDKATRLGRILDDSSNEIYVFDAESLRFTQVNQGAQRNLGYTVEELKNLTPLDFKPEFTRESFEMLIAPLRTGKNERINFTTVHRRKNGTDYPVEVQLQLMRHETPPAFVAIIQDITERRRTEEQLNYLAYYDTLTGLPNRTRLLERLQQAMLDAGRVDRLAAVMFLDLDRFKYINDTLGHHVGDGLLKGVAERLKTCVRSGDIIARLGGDEFTVVLSSVAHADDVARVARKILENFAEPFRIEGHDLYTTPSIGITIYPFDDNDAEGLLKNADAAMYHAKEQGRNSFKFFTAELNVRAERRLKLETALRRALERDELSLHYQPQVDMKNGRLVGMEALLRWQNPELGNVSPAEFIPIAEETGLILPIGNWVLREACRQIKAWHATKFSFSKMQVAVNISGKQLRQKDFPDQVRSVLLDTNLEPRYLDLELTESLLMVDAEDTGDIMHTLHDMGISFSVDDFGTGYSSLSYLKRFPIDILKIDQSFVRDITSDPNDVAIVKTIIAMAHTLGMRVIAEGVETYEQLAFLRDQDCDGSQGYYCSKPLAANDFTELLADWERISLGRCRAKPARRRVQKKSRPTTRRRRVRK